MALINTIFTLSERRREIFYGRTYDYTWQALEEIRSFIAADYAELRFLSGDLDRMRSQTQSPCRRVCHIVRE